MEIVKLLFHIVKDNGLDRVCLWSTVIILVLSQVKAFEKFMRWWNRDQIKADSALLQYKKLDDNKEAHGVEDTKLFHKLDLVIQDIRGRVTVSEMEIARNTRQFDTLQEGFNKHLEKKIQEDILFAEQRAEIKHIAEKIIDLKDMLNKLQDNQKEFFNIINEVKMFLMK